MRRFEPQEIREKYRKDRVRYQSFNLLRVLERSAGEGKVKSHVEDLKNKTNGPVRGQNGMTRLKKGTLNSHLRVSAFSRFCKVDEAPQCVESGW